MNRSLERDYDIHYHRRALLQAMGNIEAHAFALAAVQYDPVEELQKVEQKCRSLREEFEVTLL